MAQYTKLEFQEQTDLLFPTNGIGAITAARIREHFGNTADSFVIKATGKTAAPTANDDSLNSAGNGAFGVGDVWIDETNDEAYICVDATVNAAVWENLISGSGGPANIAVEEEGAPVVSADTINFVGSAVTVTDVGGVATVTITGGVPSIDVEDEGTPIVSATTLNFQGSAVAVTDVGGVATITISGGSGVITAQDLGLALTGDPVDGDDGAVLALLLAALAEDPNFNYGRIQFSQDNNTTQPFAMYINSTLEIPSNVEVDFGGMEILFGANGRIRMQGAEDEIRPGDRLLTPNGELARIETSVSAGSTTLELDNAHVASDPSLFNIGEYIVIRGENDAANNSLQRDIVKITDITGFIITFEPALENSYDPIYPGSSAPTIPDRTTIAIKASFPLEADALGNSTTETPYSIRVPADALVSIGVGDWIEIEDDLFVSSVYPDTTSANKINVEVIQVIGVDATLGNERLILSRAPMNDYLVVNNPLITKVIPTKNAIMKNGRARFLAPQASRNNHVFEMIFSVNCMIDNMHVERDWATGFGPIGNSHRARACVNCSITNCSTISPVDLTSARGYGATLYYSYGCKIDKYYAQGCRHSLLLQCASRNIITNFTSHDCAISDIDFHGINERENVVSDFTVIGGPTAAPGTTSRTGIKFGNTFHLYGSHDNIVQNGIVRLGDAADRTTRGVEFLPASTGNKVHNVKISYCQYGVLMTDQSASSDSVGPDDPIFMEENVVSDVIIEDAFDYAIRVKSNNANAGANTERTTDDLVLRNIECRRCGGGVYIEQTNRVQIDNIKFIDQTNSTSGYAMNLIDNTNLIVRGVAIINGLNGINLTNCPDAYIDDVFFDLTGTIALDDNGGNDGTSVTEMKFRGTTATHDFGGSSVFKALTNSVRKSARIASAIAADTNITDATSIVNDSSLAPVVTDGVQIISTSYTPVAPATVLDIEVVIPTIITTVTNIKYVLTIFDGSTCIGVIQSNIDSTGAASNDYLRARILHPITGYTPRVLTARFGPRDGSGTVTLTLYSRHKNTTLAQPYMIINDLGLV